MSTNPCQANLDFELALNFPGFCKLLMLNRNGKCLECSVSVQHVLSSTEGLIGDAYSRTACAPFRHCRDSLKQRRQVLRYIAYRTHVVLNDEPVPQLELANA